MISMPFSNRMPIICLIERVHTDFKEGDALPTKVKLLHMEKTMLALCLNADSYLLRGQAKLNAFTVAAQNAPLTDMQSKSKELLLGLKVLLKEYCPAAFRTDVLVGDCNWGGRDPGSGKNALAVLESSLLLILSLLGDQWENVEYIETFVAALVTWQLWHSRTPGCIHRIVLLYCMISANFKGVVKFCIVFGIWLIWGLNLTIRNWNIAMVQNMGFKTRTETVSRSPLLFIP